MALKQADRIESNNPSAYGVVKAIEVSGHKSVKTINDLYKIADCILSDSKFNHNDDAIGQAWYVIDSLCNYRLVNWSDRKNKSGWKKEENSTTISEVKTQVEINTETINQLTGTGEGSIAKAIQDLKASILGNVTEECDNLGKIENKIQALRESLKISDITNGIGTTIENSSGVVKINISTDNESIKLNDDGKLSVITVDGGTY